MIVLGVALEMLGKVVDALGQNRDLDFGRAGVALATCMFLDERLLALRGNRHRAHSNLFYRLTPRTPFRPPAVASTRATGVPSAVAMQAPALRGPRTASVH